MTDPRNTASTVERLLSDVIGSGPRSAEDMSREQAREAFREILLGEPDPTTLGAFFLANRWKGNTPEELAGFVDVMVEESVDRASPAGRVVDCGANYDGKDRTALLGVAAGIVAGTAGASVAVHSGDRIPTTRGTTYKHVLDVLGVETNLSPAQSADMIDRTGFGFYYQPRFNPRIDDLLDRRERTAVRTVINTIEPLANPAAADVHLGSFYHLAFAEKLVETIATSERLAFDRVLLFQGLEGYDDLRPGRTKLATWDGGELVPDEIETAELGVSLDEAHLAVDDVASRSAELTEAVLAGAQTGHVADAIALNAALRLYAAETVDDLRVGMELARAVIADGEAAETLEELRAYRPHSPESTA